MIDSHINHTYIIKVNFFIKKNGLLEPVCCIFTSNHDCTSKRFDEWAKNRVKLVEGFSHFAEDIYSQQTIAIENFCN